MFLSLRLCSAYEYYDIIILSYESSTYITCVSFITSLRAI